MNIIGIDEVGRGPLAGPLVIGATFFTHPNQDSPTWLEWLRQLKDSKKLSARQREELAKQIQAVSITRLGWVSAQEIDQVGISQALSLATKRAIQLIQSENITIDQIVIDGTVNFLKNTALEQKVITLKKADDIIKQVSAASIVAKVARDAYMTKIAQAYPEYGFDKHMGYGTARHLEALQQFGPCPEHRYCYKPVKMACSNPLEHSMHSKSSPQNTKNTTITGSAAETAVAQYLEKQGHVIIARNFKTRFYEIDLISYEDAKLYFTEVRYRSNNICGSGIDSIDFRKQRQIKFAAQSFLAQKQLRFTNKNNKAQIINLQDFHPQIAVAEVEDLKNTPKVNWFPIEL